jgi:hypothetical protein
VVSGTAPDLTTSLSQGGDFGPGLYFSPQACKAVYYAENHLVIAEVALGLEDSTVSTTTRRVVSLAQM